MSRQTSPQLPLSKLMHSKKLLWVTDPWSTLDHSQDTTLRLAEEALNLGFECYWSGSDFVLSENSPHLSAIPLAPNFIKTLDPLAQNFRKILAPSDFHHLHYRVDPPVDFNYISLVEKFLEKRVKESQILNPPALITRQSEKVPPPELLHLAPLLRVIRSETDARTAFEIFKAHSVIVTKPMNLAQSRGVKKHSLTPSLREFVKILEIETQGFSESILVEEYLPDVMKGEVRMWFANGECVAALKKFPKTGDFRVLIDEGSKVEAYSLNSDEEKIALEVGACLKKQGAMMAAIDFISGKISDYNITSPGLLKQLEQVHDGKNLAKSVLEKIYSN